jgi:phosphoesterase RecJ-like protein
MPNIIVPDSFPGFLSFLPGAGTIKFFDRQRKSCLKILEKTDLIFCLDFNTMKRIDELGEWASNVAVPKVLIDHHPFPDEVFDYSYHRTDVSSTSELIFEFCRILYPGIHIGKHLATSLYAGLLTDTGTFRHNIHESTFFVAGELFKAGADHAAVIHHIFNSNSLNRMKLLGYSLNDKLTILPEYGTAYICLSLEELARFNHKKGDTEGFANQALSIEGVKMAVLLTEQSENLTKLSFRSKGNFAINKFASTYFKGGGHKNAAGGVFEGTVDKAEAYLLTHLPEVERLNA